MSYVWIATSVSYYVISFELKYLNGSMYANTDLSTIAQVIMIVLAGALYLRVGPKVTLFCGFLSAAIGAILIETVGRTSDSWMMVFVMITKAGLGAVFGAIYVTNYIFPVQYASQTLGICNLLSRMFTILSPIIAEFSEPIPMVVIICLSLSACLMLTQLILDSPAKSKK